MPHARAAHKNARPNARTRAKEVTEYSPGYWDLLLGEGRHWSDPFDPEREAAWQAWRERLKARWPFGWSHGERPDAWFYFDAPTLYDASDLSAADYLTMSSEEEVYHLDADAAERASIEETWRQNLGHVLRYFPTRPADAADTPRQWAIESWGIPGWFFDKYVHEH
jgi:hypothetical protein